MCPQPRPPAISACLVARSTTRQVLGEKTPWSWCADSPSGRCCPCTICTVSASTLASIRPSRRASGCARAATGIRRTSAIGRLSRSLRSASSSAIPQAERFSRTCAVTPERISVKSSSPTSGCSRAKSLANATSDSVGNMTSTTMCSVRSAPRFRLATSSSSAPTSCSTLAAASTIASPCAVSTGTRPVRSKSRSPSCASSRSIAWLTAACTRPSLRAAAEKLPASATARSVRSCSIVTPSIWRRLTPLAAARAPRHPACRRPRPAAPAERL